MQWHFHPLLPAWQQVLLLPFKPEDARKGQCFLWGIPCWRREADPTVIPPAPLDTASLESMLALLQRGGRRQATQHRHMSSSGERQDLCFQEGK